jgi:uncharacterized protein (TIGR02453 family)
VSPPPFTGWPPAALEWFRGLEADNSRAWFQANRRTYDEAVRQPLESLLAEVEDEFGEAKVFRPNRDTRFSADKTPYKTQVAALAGGAPGEGGFYVQLGKDGLFVGGCLYHPERARLARVRAAIDDDRRGATLAAIVADLRAGKLELLTDGALKTAPRGYAADHPRIELLRQVNIAAGRTFAPARWLHSKGAKDRVVSAWRSLRPLHEWLAAC